MAAVYTGWLALSVKIGTASRRSSYIFPRAARCAFDRGADVLVRVFSQSGRRGRLPSTMGLENLSSRAPFGRVAISLPREFRTMPLLLNSTPVELNRFQVATVARLYHKHLIEKTHVEQITYLSDGLRVQGYCARPSEPAR
jgi:hypothetical protein